MIKSITSFNSYFTINTSPSVYVNSTGHIDTGSLKYDVQTQCLKIHNGYGYDAFGQTVDIQPSQMMTDVMNWAYCKMQEEKQLQKRLDKYPTLKSAYEKFQLLDQLTVEYENDK